MTPDNQSPSPEPQAAIQESHTPAPVALPPRPRRVRQFLLYALVLIGLGVGLWWMYPTLVLNFTTISTDDAYVNSYPAFVAPRVAGQVKDVLVEDNNKVKKGDLLVVLDEVPYQVQLEIRQAAVTAAETDLAAANAQVRAQVALARSNRFKLERAIEDVNTQISNLRATVATLNSKKATLVLARQNLKRGEDLAPSGGVSKEDLDQRRQQVKVNEAAVEQTLETIYSIRVGLGLPAQPLKGHDRFAVVVAHMLGRGVQANAVTPWTLALDAVRLSKIDLESHYLTEVPPNLDQDFSSVRQALGELIQSAAVFGYSITRWDATPKEVIEEFYKQDPEGNLNHIYEHLIPNAPAIKQAEAKLLQAQSDLDQAKLNLKYCKIVSDIDGVVTRRNVQVGNNVQVGQALMAVRPIKEIWVDANFKETQLADLRIGQRVRLEVDMYGSRKIYQGRVTGFTMGTGQTLALLPPQNATGNFVKIVQRLPVRIELTDYDPSTEEKYPLFVGLSVTPYVFYREPASGADAGKFLQPVQKNLPNLPTNPTP
jgi:membrane fusion protein, multidrug efflux system